MCPYDSQESTESEDASNGVRYSVYHRHVQPTLGETSVKPHGLYWSSSTSMAGSLEDLSPASASSTSVFSVASSLISDRWTGSRFQLALEYIQESRVSISAFSAAIVNFTNSIVGAGLMGIPYALSRAGLVPGILLLIIVAVISGIL